MRGMRSGHIGIGAPSTPEYIVMAGLDPAIPSPSRARLL
jgi:hypothetical protein